jgi:hypothetical protein
VGWDSKVLPPLREKKMINKEGGGTHRDMRIHSLNNRRVGMLNLQNMLPMCGHVETSSKAESFLI